MNPHREPHPRSNEAPESRAARPPRPKPGEAAYPAGLAPLSPPATFVAEARAIGVHLDPSDIRQLGRYLALLLEANRIHNLTAVTEPAHAWTRHVLDSVTLMQFLAELPAGSRVIDVGSGGGLPGVPLAICLPEIEFTLLDATGKKIEFLRHVALELGLKNVRVVQERAERAGQDHREHRERYDAAVARAVGPTSVIAELTVPFVKVIERGVPRGVEGASEVETDESPAGRVYLIKGGKSEEELSAARQALHLLHVAHVGTVETPTGRIVVLEKLRKTPRLYPRSDGEPKRSPL